MHLLLELLLPAVSVFLKLDQFLLAHAYDFAPLTTTKP